MRKNKENNLENFIKVKQKFKDYESENKESKQTLHFDTKRVFRNKRRLIIGIILILIVISPIIMIKLSQKKTFNNQYKEQIDDVITWNGNEKKSKSIVLSSLDHGFVYNLKINVSIFKGESLYLNQILNIKTSISFDDDGDPYFPRSYFVLEVEGPIKMVISFVDLEIPKGPKDFTALAISITESTVPLLILTMQNSFNILFFLSVVSIILIVTFFPVLHLKENNCYLKNNNITNYATGTIKGDFFKNSHFIRWYHNSEALNINRNNFKKKNSTEMSTNNSYISFLKNIALLLIIAFLLLLVFNLDKLSSNHFSTNYVEGRLEDFTLFVSFKLIIWIVVVACFYRIIWNFIIFHNFIEKIIFTDTGYFVYFTEYKFFCFVQDETYETISIIKRLVIHDDSSDYEKYLVFENESFYFRSTLFKQKIFTIFDYLQKNVKKLEFDTTLT